MNAPDIEALLDDVMQCPSIPDELKTRLYKANRHHLRTLSRFNTFYTAIVGFLWQKPKGEQRVVWPKSSLEQLKEAIMSGQTPGIHYEENGEDCIMSIGEVMDIDDAPPEVQAAVRGILEGGGR